MVSIIVPVYNLEKHVGICLERLINQTYKDIEIIVVDDGSTDFTLKVCKQYSEKDSRIKVFTKRNGGVSSARNFGIEKSISEFIVFVDGDDIVSEDFVELLVNNLHGNIFSSVGQKITFTTEVDFDNNRSVEYITSDDYLKRLLLDTINYSACGKMFLKNKMNSIRFIEGKKENEDKFFLFEYILENKGNISIIKNELYAYLCRKDSATHSSNNLIYFDKLYFADKIVDCIKKNRLDYLEYANYNKFITQLSVLKKIVQYNQFNINRKYYDQIREEVIRNGLPSNIDISILRKLEYFSLKVSRYCYPICIKLFYAIFSKKYKKMQIGV